MPEAKGRNRKENVVVKISKNVRLTGVLVFMMGIMLYRAGRVQFMGDI